MQDAAIVRRPQSRADLPRDLQSLVGSETANAMEQREA